MSGLSAMEYRKDCIGEKLYASRNWNQLRHTYLTPGANRASLDWNLTLRQVRKKPAKQETASLPNLELHTAALREGRVQQPLTSEHEEGPYHGNTETVGLYQNVGNSEHMIGKLCRVSSGPAFTIDWQLNLRDSMHKKPDDKWRRYFTRPQQTFDMMKENCSASNAEYQKSHITPQDRRMDRRSGAISIATIRDDPLSFKRAHGCEGTHVGQWRHLIEDRSRGHKTRRQLAHETTLREDPHDKNGARTSDSRSDGCWVEMLGKKKWVGHVSHEPLMQRPPDGDPKMHHMSRLMIKAEADEDNREVRMTRQSRTDQNIPDEHPGKSRQRNQETE